MTWVWDFSASKKTTAGAFILGEYPAISSEYKTVSDRYLVAEI